MPNIKSKLTILDIKNHLFAYFLSESTFNISEDLNRIKLGSVYDKGELLSQKESLVKVALSEMEKNGIITHLSVDTYILMQPLMSYNQNVQITSTTANLIGEIINSIDKNNYICNKLSITDVDINLLAQLCLIYKDSLSKIFSSVDHESLGKLEDFGNLELGDN